MKALIVYHQNNELVKKLEKFLDSNKVEYSKEDRECLTDECYKLNSFVQDVAQLGSAGALGVTEYTNQMYCNN